MTTMKNKGLRKCFTYLLILTLLFTSLGLTGLGIGVAYAADNTITFSIETKTINGEYLFGPVEVSLEANDTVYTVLQRIADSNPTDEITVTGADYEYVTEICSIIAGSYGGFDGWMASVNNQRPYPLPSLKSGDIVRFCYSYKDFGSDIDLFDLIEDLKAKVDEADEITFGIDPDGHKAAALIDVLTIANAKISEIESVINSGSELAYLDSITVSGPGSETEDINNIMMRLDYAMSGTEYIPVTSVVISPVNEPEAYIAGGSYKFSATVLPANATDKTIHWSIGKGNAYITSSGSFYPMSSENIEVQIWNSDISATNPADTFSIPPTKINERTISLNPLQSVLNYYKNDKNSILNDWWELAAVYNTGEDLTNWVLPNTSTGTNQPTDYAGTIISDLIKGSSVDTPAQALANLQNSEGIFNAFANQQSWAIIALNAAKRGANGATINNYDEDKAIIKLLQYQKEDGGFNYTIQDVNGDPDVSAMAAIALSSYSGNTTSVINAINTSKTSLINYFKYGTALTPTGGYDGGYGENINTVATVVSGLEALGITPSAVSHYPSYKTPLDSMAVYQLSNGGFEYCIGDGYVDTFGTKQAALALSDVNNHKSLLATLEKSSVKLFSTEVEIQGMNGQLFKGKATVQSEDSLSEIVNDVLIRAGKVQDLTGYLYYLNDTLTDASTCISADGLKILAVPNSIQKIASFDKQTATAGLNTPVTFTLSQRLVGGTLSTPMAGIQVMVDGEVYGGYFPLTTDSNGQFSLSFLEAGTYKISANIADAAISKPLCTLTVAPMSSYSKNVSIRVEGIKENLAYNNNLTVTSDGSKILTVYDALKTLLPVEGDILGTSSYVTGIKGTFGGTFGGWDGWLYTVNGSMGSGMGNQVLNNGDKIVVYYGEYSTMIPKITVTQVGNTAQVLVQGSGFDFSDNQLPLENISDVTVTLTPAEGDMISSVTNSSGVVEFIDLSPGRYQLQINKNTTISTGSGIDIKYLPAFIRLAPDHKIIISNQHPVSELNNTVDLSDAIIDDGIHTINVPEGILAKIMITTDSGIELPEIESTTSSLNGAIVMTIAEGTTVNATGDDSSQWDGTIQLPTVINKTLTGKTVSTAISVGDSGGGTTIHFSKPVRLLIPKAAGKSIGFIDSEGFHEITNTISADNLTTAISTLIGDVDEAKISIGNDVAVWTNHFTTFVSYTEDDTSLTPDESNVSLRVVGNGKVMFPTTQIPWVSGMTAYSLLVAYSGLNIEGDGSYISYINGIGEFSHGENSGWLYSVNGVDPTRSSSSYRLQIGDIVVWHFTNDYTKEPSSAKWTDELINQKTTIISVEVDSQGKATATLTKQEFNDIISSDSNTLRINSEIATLTFDKNALKTISNEAVKDIKITAMKVDTSKLPEELKLKIGDRPVYDFTVTSGNKTISKFNGKVTVSIPYTPSSDEVTSSIVIYYINDSGKLELIKNCKYDSTKKIIVFNTDHFSQFAIGYNNINFSDINGHWSESNINYLAARGIINGKGAGKFKPNDNITRAEFVTILANKAGVNFSEFNNDSSSNDTTNESNNIVTQSPFNDVKTTDWFSKSVTWASENNIVTGSNGKFRPNDRITRQEMAVVIDRYMTRIEQISIAPKNKEIKFYDDAKIASYAKSSVSKMQQLGIINGKTSTTFSPTDNATRAESSKMISILMQSAI